MITSIQGTAITIVCPFCRVPTTYDVAGLTVPFNEQLKEYPLLDFVCACGVENGVNLNIPTSDEEEGLDSEKISTALEVTRFYVRVLQRMVLPEFRKEVQ